jgi:hypothetical protein
MSKASSKGLLLYKCCERLVFRLNFLIDFQFSSQLGQITNVSSKCHLRQSNLKQEAYGLPILAQY